MELDSLVKQFVAMRLEAWSRRAILQMWAWWIGGLITITLSLSLVAYWAVQRDVSSSQANVAGRIGYLPTQSTDILISIYWPAMAWNLAFLLGPPGIVTLLWWHARHRHRDRPT
jgi:hypothetical protein